MKTFMMQKRLVRYIAAFLVCILFLVLTVGRTTNVVTSMLKKELLQQVSDVTQNNLLIISQSMESDMGDLNRLAAGIAALGGTESASAKEFILREEWKGESMHLVAANKAGKAYSNDGKSKNIAEDEIFKAVIKGEPQVSSVRQDLIHTDLKESIIMAVPIWKDGGAIGFLGLVRNASYYQHLMRSPLYEESGSAYIIDKSGALVLQSKNGNQGDQFVPTNFFQDEEKMAKAPELVKMRENIAAGESGSIIYKGELEEAVFLAYAPLGVNDWYLVNQVNGSVVEMQKQMLRRGAGTVGILAAVIFAALLIAIYRMDNRRVKFMEQVAMFDQLTGLPNWQNIKKHFEELHTKQGWVYLLLRIPDFRRVSSAFGYTVAARVLKDISLDLKGAIMPKEIAAHVSEDCFALLLHEEEINLEWRINELFSKLKRIPLTDEVIIYDYYCSYIGGAYRLEEEDDDFSVISRRANMAIESKAVGESLEWAWFNKKMETQIQMQDSLMPEILKALKQEEFIPYFQPQYDLETKEIIGAEVLARWNHPKHGVLLPATFVPLMEASGCVLELDLIMLEQACKMIHQWLEAGCLPVPLSVNISRLNIHRRDFLDRLLGIVHSYDIPTNLISLELTETAIFDNTQKVLELTRTLKGEGFVLSMDDFGTGYSSLNMLGEIKVDIVKLDQVFLKTAEAGPRGRTVLEHVVRMARELEIELIAEGVETEEQKQVVQEIGCKIVQGFLFSRPVAAKEFETLLFTETPG